MESIMGQPSSLSLRHSSLVGYCLTVPVVSCLVTLAAQREGREPTGRTRSESGREVSDRHA